MLSSGSFTMRSTLPMPPPIFTASALTARPAFFAFHTDAGTTLNDSIIGSLGIYSTAGDVLGNGSTRMASRDLTDLVLSNITDDVRAQFEPNWTRRGMWDKSYFEARVPEVPAMLLELLSHQNFADMKYGLDPEFRFAVTTGCASPSTCLSASTSDGKLTPPSLPATMRKLWMSESVAV